MRMRRSGDLSEDAQNLLDKSSEGEYKSAVTERFGCWQVIPGIVIWNIWLERKQRIFQNTEKSLKQLIAKLDRNIVEIIESKLQREEDLDIKEEERRILEEWGIKIANRKCKETLDSTKMKSSSIWESPRRAHIKFILMGSRRGTQEEQARGGRVY